MIPIVNSNSGAGVPFSDRALQYGDGVFSTVRIADGQAQLWPLHQARLQAGLQRLAIHFEEWPILESQVHECCRKADQGVLKVWISRGVGGRGYAPPVPCRANWALSLHALPDHYARWRHQGVVLGTSPIRLAKQPLLAGIKHLNRLEQVLVKQDLAAREWDDALVCDTDGMVVESSAANLFWHSQGHWFTPDLRHAGIAGVMRQYVLQQFSDAKQQVEVVRITADGLRHADSLFMCNSLMGIVPVRQCNDIHYDMTLVKQLQEQWAFA